MTKTYTGFEALERMKTHWIQKEDIPFNKYRFEDGVVKAKNLVADCYLNTSININLFFNSTFVDYVESLVAGDIVKITTPHGAFVFGTVDKTNYSVPKPIITVQGSDAPHYADRAVRITEEEFKVEQRKEMFRLAGRALNQFHNGDVVEVSNKLHTYQATVLNQGGDRLEIPNIDANVPGSYGGSTYVNASEVKPIRFVTFVDAITPRRIKVEPPVAPCNGQAPMAPTGVGEIF